MYEPSGRERAVANAPVTRRRRKRRHTGLLLVVPVAVAAVASTAAAIGFGGAGHGAATNGSAPTATAQVTRMTLQDTEDAGGNLGYGDSVKVTTRLGGTITALPASGTQVRRGQALFQVDGAPVVLMYGAVPLYRRLAPGIKGPDVKEFEENLNALGYHGFTVDDSYDANTGTAVRSWQNDLGLAQSGLVDPGRVVFAPAAVRIDSDTAQVGDPATGAVLSYTGTTREVVVELDVSKQGQVKQNAAATITLPDGSTVDGKITAIGTVAQRQSPGPNVAATSSTAIEATVSITDQGKLGSLEFAPVTVHLVVARRENVLTVPVAALLALAEGGYGVQVVEGTGSHVVAVKVGLFAGGRVEITGPGIDAGTVVGVPS
jgi:peptidoglycan hydrolase-like protein with peptidoglycan-binding domain